MLTPFLEEECKDDIMDDEERWETELEEVKVKDKVDNVNLENLGYR